MKTKERRRTKWIVTIGVAAVIVAGILFGSVLRKDKEVDLVITADNISLEQGEIKPLEYKSSVKKADIRIRVQDVKIVEVEEKTVHGKAVGNTEIIITGRYESMVCEKRIVVTVTEKGEDKPNEKPENPGDNNGEGEENPPEIEEPLEIEMMAIYGCTVKEGKITISAGKLARVKLMSEEDMRQMKIESGKLEVSMAEEIYGMMVIYGEEPGEQEITLRIGNKTAKINVEVKGE